MPDENQRNAKIAQVGGALKGSFIGDKFETPDWATQKDVTDALPVLTLVPFGGPSAPPMPKDRDRPELKRRLERARSRLKELAPRFKDVSNPELRKWLHENDKSGELLDEEGKRICEATLLLFQLDSEPCKGKEAVRAEAGSLWKKGGRWVERQREEFICERLATWLVEDEERQLANPAGSQVAPKPEHQQSRATAEEKPARDEQIPGAEPSPRPTVAGWKEVASAWLTKCIDRLLAVPPPSKKILTIAAVPTALILVFVVLVSVGKEHVRSSASTVTALDCGDGKTEDYGFSPAEFPDNPELVDPATVTVNVGRISFRFEKLIDRNREYGVDSWDFIFRSRSTPGLTFIFRNDPSNGGGFGYVIDGSPGEGLEPTNKVCNLIDFHKSALGEFLADRSDEEGFEWARRIGSR